MITVKVPLKNAEQVKNQLITKNLFNNKYKVLKKGSYLYIPVTSKQQVKETVPEAQFSSIQLPRIKQKPSIREALTKKLTHNELEQLKTAHDQIGSIAIIEVDPELSKREKQIANTLLKLNPSIKTVYKKAAAHEGKFRVQKLRYLAGERKSETEYKENNITIQLDVKTVYFSPRLGNERKRITKQVKKGEKVMVLFSGCGPYVCSIAKNSKASEVWGIEINPEASRYAFENTILNKLSNTRLFRGDVKKIVPKLKQKFDRILMPLPKTSESFLSSALTLAKKGTIIHFYSFQKQGEFKKAVNKIKKACKKAKKTSKILEIVKCGQHAPYIYRICVDFKIS